MDQNNEASRITFEGEEIQRPSALSQTQTPRIVRWVMQNSGGLIKDEKQAQYALVGFVITAIILVSILVFSDGATDAKFEAPPGQRIVYPENAPPRLEAQF